MGVAQCDSSCVGSRVSSASSNCVVPGWRVLSSWSNEGDGLSAGGGLDSVTVRDEGNPGVGDGANVSGARGGIGGFGAAEDPGTGGVILKGLVGSFSVAVEAGGADVRLKRAHSDAARMRY
jgi:hypothetical protein